MIACHTATFVDRIVPSAKRVPLLFTRDLLMASSLALEAAVLAIAQRGRYGDIHSAATVAYAKGQGRDARRLRRIFSNPVDRRWPAVDKPVLPANSPRPTPTAK